MSDGTDIWPHVIKQAVGSPSGGGVYEQVMSTASVDAAIALGLVDGNDFAGQDTSKLLILIVKEPDVNGGEETTAVHLYEKEDMLRYAIGMVQRITADIGPEAAREIMNESRAPGPEIDEPDGPRN